MSFVFKGLNKPCKKQFKELAQETSQIDATIKTLE
jgi:hypothetical protein